MSLLDAIDASRAILWLPCRDSYVSGGMTVTRNLGTAAGAPANVQLGDGVTPATHPGQFYPRGLLFNGTSQYLRANVVLPNATYTFGFVLQHSIYSTGRYILDCRAGGGTGFVLATPTVTPPAATLSGLASSVDGLVTTTLQRGAVSVVMAQGVAEAPSYVSFGVVNALNASYFAGKMLAIALFPGALTTLQMAEWGRRAMQEARMP